MNLQQNGHWIAISLRCQDIYGNRIDSLNTEYSCLNAKRAVSWRHLIAKIQTMKFVVYIRTCDTKFKYNFMAVQSLVARSYSWALCKNSNHIMICLSCNFDKVIWLCMPRAIWESNAHLMNNLEVFMTSVNYHATSKPTKLDDTFHTLPMTRYVYARM